MRFCSYCGKEIENDAYICVHCGRKVSSQTEKNQDDAPSTGLAVLSFFIPLIGLILFLMWNNTSPLKAKSCGKGALIGVIVSIILTILSVAGSTCLAASLYDSYYCLG